MCSSNFVLCSSLACKRMSGGAESEAIRFQAICQQSAAESQPINPLILPQGHNSCLKNSTLTILQCTISGTKYLLHTVWNTVSLKSANNPMTISTTAISCKYTPRLWPHPYQFDQNLQLSASLKLILL